MLNRSLKYFNNYSPNHISHCSSSLGFVCGPGCRFVLGSYSVWFHWTTVMMSCVSDTCSPMRVFHHIQREMVIGLFLRADRPVKMSNPSFRPILSKNISFASHPGMFHQ